QEPKPTIEALLDQVFTAQNALELRFATVSAECSDVSAYIKEWQLAVHFNKQITQELSVAAHRHFSHQQDRHFINNFDDGIEEIQALFKRCQEMWDNDGPAYRTQAFNVDYNEEALARASHLEKGSALTLGHLIKLMHQSLSRLAESISCIDSVTNNIS
ncbi:FUSC family protein, partial [Vibrio astriarenae]